MHHGGDVSLEYAYITIFESSSTGLFICFVSFGSVLPRSQMVSYIHTSYMSVGGDSYRIHRMCSCSLALTSIYSSTHFAKSSLSQSLFSRRRRVLKEA